jgi:hypothetical protein
MRTHSTSQPCVLQSTGHHVGESLPFCVDVVRMPVVDMTMLRRACSVNKIILCVWYSRVHDHSDIASDTLYAIYTAAATSVNAYSTSKQFRKTVL